MGILRQFGTSGILATLLALPNICYPVCNIVGDNAYGDCGNVTVNSGPAKSIDVRTSRSVSGIVGDVTVHPGGQLYLSGVADDITIKGGGSAIVTGVANNLLVYGKVKIPGIANVVRVAGGELVLEGQVNAISGNGDIQIRQNSIIAGIPQQAHQTSSHTMVELLQRCLKYLGYDPGSADGLAGRKTRTAVAQYQRARGLPLTGEWFDINQSVINECHLSE